jgi:hypothetical protein
VQGTVGHGTGPTMFRGGSAGEGRDEFSATPGKHSLIRQSRNNNKMDSHYYCMGVYQFNPRTQRLTYKASENILCSFNLQMKEKRKHIRCKRD